MERVKLQWSRLFREVSSYSTKDFSYLIFPNSITEDLGSAMPTVGFSRAEFSLKKHRVVAYDLGGGERIREIWSTYYAEVSFPPNINNLR